ncbi:hypothetical protein DY000_02060300 [Brassica cretica]|uniref:Uncharacterized protein n=1 Tax=Brassica cretica TaxID=69181 RepID=A0ABQ7AWU2_BRACR|nr:hypothetical protein DY000_02060300 [Brassica cretica]
MTERDAYVKMVVAHAKRGVWELKLGLKMAQDRERANAAQLATAEKLGNQAASLEACLRVVSNERKSALEQGFFWRRRSNLLQEKWEKKKAAADCEARLKEVMANIDLLKEIMNNNLLASDELLRLQSKDVELGSELDVMAVSDFSVGKLDLPQISEDLPEEFFARVPSETRAPVRSGIEVRSGGEERSGPDGRSWFEVPIGGIRCVWVTPAVPLVPWVRFQFSSQIQ